MQQLLKSHFRSSGFRFRKEGAHARSPHEIFWVATLTSGQMFTYVVTKQLPSQTMDNRARGKYGVHGTLLCNDSVISIPL